MAYQSKTTMISVGVGEHSVNTESLPVTRFSVIYEIMALIGSRCEMDLISMTPTAEEDGATESEVVAIFLNNGHSLSDICKIMQPLVDVFRSNYKIISFAMYEDLFIDCIATIKSSSEEW